MKFLGWPAELFCHQVLLNIIGCGYYYYYYYDNSDDLYQSTKKGQKSEMVEPGQNYERKIENELENELNKNYKLLQQQPFDSAFGDTLYRV